MRTSKKHAMRWCDRCQDFTPHRKCEVVLASVTMPDGEMYGATTDVWECELCKLQTLITEAAPEAEG